VAPFRLVPQSAAGGTLLRRREPEATIGPDRDAAVRLEGGQPPLAASQHRSSTSLTPLSLSLSLSLIYIQDMYSFDSVALT